MARSSCDEAIQGPRAAAPDRGREGFYTSPPSEPYGRFSRIRLSSRWFPHRGCLACRQAVSRVNSPAVAKNLFGRQTIPNSSFDTVTGADSMRSVQTEPSTRDRSRASAPCLAICISGAVMASSRLPTSIFLPCLPSPGVCSPSLSRRDPSRDPPMRYYAGSDSSPAHPAGKVSPLTPSCLPRIPLPTT